MDLYSLMVKLAVLNDCLVHDGASSRGTMMATLTNSLRELTTNQRDTRINKFTPKVCRQLVKPKGKSPRNEDLLSSSDVFSRSRERFLNPWISLPAQEATVLKVLSKRLEVWSHATVVCL